ncbi:class I SAM-dependent methyltransferase [Chitinophaga solisilvae]|uniref:class I SAM-dependent methyltransferase n=1 Tax=Chitinophaga solisilvae TaxID=1233460 RepID=UPI001367C4FD|nr:class I SAM-dependent methyltransferase [Chitinophaga solisilvae]
MIALLKTAERTSHTSFINNYVFQRHVFAYKAIPLEHVAGRHVLELGSGEGYGIQLLSRYSARYLALDKHKPFAEFLPVNASFEQCDLPDLSRIPDNTFDTIVCFQVIEHIKDDHTLLREARRVLKPGGTMFLTTPNRLTSLTRNPFHVREYLPAEMKALIRTHFAISEVQGIYGNDRVMSYYQENKKSVEAITRFDILNLQYRLSAVLLRGPYTLMNNINRWLLVKKMADVTVNIEHKDFFRQHLQDDCLDYFVTAVKEQ